MTSRTLKKGCLKSIKTPGDPAGAYFSAVAMISSIVFT